ncbi:MAG: hypothetical protein HY673_21700 [Chloroflexi bacterium]|nr:hypothetical protein [Chloroflexota bacterium]
MIRRKVAIRPAMIRPVTVRRSAITGETRAYQELIRLNAEHTRVLQERHTCTEKRRSVESQLKTIEGYKKDIFKLLESFWYGDQGRPETKGEAPPGGNEEKPSPQTMDFRF